ncbi:serine hydrolase domain-containing protein [Candidatus Phycosocius spiralis]|nr:serine hydrolase domain-containing protein [Candidatus Phycosocius spiralis]
MKIQPRTMVIMAALVVLLGLAMAIGWSDWQGSQRAGWKDGDWTSVGSSEAIQKVLDQETRANTNIPGQILYVRAPSLKLDQAWVAGPDLRTDDDVRVASNTKTFVAAMALMLVEEGTLKLDAPIGPYVSPKVRDMLRANDYGLETITLRQLLNHTSGIPDYFGVGLFAFLALVPNAYGLSAHWTPETEIWFAVTFGQKVEPGKTFAYSDTNYLIAADMIKVATKAPNIGVAARGLLQWPKLGADETYWEALEPEPKGTRRTEQFRGGIRDSAVDVSYDQYGGGGLVMSMDDLGLATRAVVLGQVFKDPARTIKLMQTAGPDPIAGGYALGIEPITLAGETCWGHGGFWGTAAFHCPRLDITVARSVGQANARFDMSKDSSPLAHLIARAQAVERAGR